MDELYTIVLRDYTTGIITQVEVTKPVFDEYRRGIWRIQKNNEKHSMQSTVFSELNTIEEETYEKFREFVDCDSDPENLVLKKIDKEKLWNAISQLNNKEQELIKALFFKDIKLSEYARSKGKTPQFIYKWRNQILKKIKRILEKMV